MDIVQGKGISTLPVKYQDNPVITIAKGVVIYCDCIAFPDHDSAILSIKLNAAGIPNVLVEIEQSIQEPQENVPDDSCVVRDDVQPVFVGGIADKKQHHSKIDIGDLQYVRIKLTEQAGIDDTTATIFVSSKS